MSDAFNFVTAKILPECATEFLSENEGLSMYQTKGIIVVLRKYQVVADGRGVHLVVHRMSLLSAENCFDIGTPENVSEVEAVKSALYKMHLYVHFSALYGFPYLFVRLARKLEFKHIFQLR